MRLVSVILLLGGLRSAGQTTVPKPTEQATGSISGTVRDAATGTPISDVQVYANRSSRDSVMAVSDAQGRYALRNVKPGRQPISAVGGAKAGVGPSQTATRFVSLLAGQDLTAIDFQISNHAAITGKIVDENKEPVADITVFLIAREYALGMLRYVYAGITTTDDRGEYSMKRVAPGRAFLLMAQKRPWKLPAISESPLDPKARKTIPAVTFYPGGTSATGAEALVLRPGELRESVDIRMRRGASRCIEGSGQATGGAEELRFQISDRQPTSGASGDGAMFVMSPSGVTGPDGKMRICELPPGEYQLTVYPNVADGPPSFYGTASISIGDRDVDKILVNARSSVSLAGEVVWVGEAPDPPITSQLALVLRPLTRAPWSGETDAVRTSIPGQFSFKHLLVDEYGLQTFGVPEGAYVKDVTYGGRSVLGEPLQIGSSIGDGGLKIALARDGGTVAASVADRDGKPVADAHVILLPVTVNSEASLATSMLSGQTDQNGAWKSPQVSAGKYHVLASPTAINKSPESIAKLWRARHRALEVELAPNGTSQLKLIPETIEPKTGSWLDLIKAASSPQRTFQALVREGRRGSLRAE
ncbi:MAG TPA: carboxypeptidase regulatory-like domain-containing protein [Bryobacteraceae bacterium]|nr:carboxypeptidase regulatory-like domain-containing protein [Bryobacteraceae bacterium]